MQLITGLLTNAGLGTVYYNVAPKFSLLSRISLKNQMQALALATAVQGIFLYYSREQKKNLKQRTFEVLASHLLINGFLYFNHRNRFKSSVIISIVLGTVHLTANQLAFYLPSLSLEETAVIQRETPLSDEIRCGGLEKATSTTESIAFSRPCASNYRTANQLALYRRDDIQEFLSQNPYTHGTGSSVLAFMTKMEPRFTLLSVEEMAVIQGKAPLSGEIHCGGLQGAALTTGSTAFSRLCANYYSIEDVIKTYAKEYGKRTNDLFLTPKYFDASINKLLKSNFTNLLAVLVEVMQYRQLNKGAIIPFSSNREEILQEIDDQHKRVRFVFQFQLFFYKFISVDSKPSFVEYGKINDFFKCLVKDSEIYKTDLEPYLDNDKITLHEEEQEELARKLKLPDCLHFRKSRRNQTCKDPNTPYELDSALLDPSSHHFLYECLRYSDDLNFYSTEIIKAVVDKGVQALDQRITQLRAQLSTNPPPSATFDNDDWALISDPFPVVFLTSQEQLLEKVGYEYRVKKGERISLTSDIPVIATDKDSIPRLQAYISRHNLSVKVTSFQKLLATKKQYDVKSPVS